MNNVQVREAKGFIPWWKIAEKAGVAEITLVKWMRKELDAEKKERVMKAIKDVKEEMLRDMQ